MKTPTKVTKSLLCSLSDDERRSYGIKLATTLEDMETVEAEKKRQSDHYKDRIAGLQAAADTLRHKVSSGQEWRDVECTVVLGQPTDSHKQIIRDDTGEVVSTEWMTEADKQGLLPLEVPGDKIPDVDIDGGGNVVDVDAEPIDDDGDDQFGPNWEDSRDEASDPDPDDEPPVAAVEPPAADPLDGDVPEFLKKKGRKKKADPAPAEPMPESDPEAPAPGAEQSDAGDDY